MKEPARPMWTCPECGHSFVTRNLWHSCGRYSLDDHFAGKDPLTRKLFDRFVSILERQGPVTVYAQKTRITCQVRVRFAGAVIRRRWIDCALWLTRRAEHPCLRRVEHIPPDCYIHSFRMAEPGDFDEAFGELAAESYVVGRGS
jgi:hypothetical protein